jgi:hypothetical protein
MLGMRELTVRDDWDAPPAPAGARLKGVRSVTCAHLNLGPLRRIDHWHAIAGDSGLPCATLSLPWASGMCSGTIRARPMPVTVAAPGRTRRPSVPRAARRRRTLGVRAGGVDQSQRLHDSIISSCMAACAQGDSRIGLRANNLKQAASVTGGGLRTPAARASRAAHPSLTPCRSLRSLCISVEVDACA